MCDILAAADDARIGFPATRALRSQADDMCLYHVSPQRAKRLLFTGDALCCGGAAKLGLVMKSVPPRSLDAPVDYLTQRIASVPSELLSTHKRIINLGLELMGARTLQRPAGETDACAHLSPAVAEFSATVKSEGLKEAPRQGDGPFGKGEARTSPAASGEQAG